MFMLSNLIIVIAAIVLLSVVVLAVLRKIFDLRQVGMAVLAGIAGAAGVLLVWVLYEDRLITFVGKFVSDHNPGDVIDEVYLSGYYTTALAGILMAVLCCLVLYLLQRYLPAHFSQDQVD